MNARINVYSLSFNFKVMDYVGKDSITRYRNDDFYLLKAYCNIEPHLDMTFKVHHLAKSEKLNLIIHTYYLPTSQ